MLSHLFSLTFVELKLVLIRASLLRVRSPHLLLKTLGLFHHLNSLNLQVVCQVLHVFSGVRLHHPVASVSGTFKFSSGDSTTGSVSCSVIITTSDVLAHRMSDFNLRLQVLQVRAFLQICCAADSEGHRLSLGREGR